MMNVRTHITIILAATILFCLIPVATIAASLSSISITNPNANNNIGYNITSTPSGVSSDTTQLLYNWYKNSTSDLILYMPFNVNNSAGTGNQRDYSDRNINGSLKNVSMWKSSGGWNNTGALYFGGVASSVDWVDLNDTTTGEGFTILLWVNYTNTSGFNPIIANSGSGANNGWKLILNSNAARDYMLYFETYDPVGNYCDAVSKKNLVTPFVWHHIAVAVNATDRYAKIYVDGVQQNNLTGGNDDVRCTFTRAGNWTLGIMGAGTTRFAGTMDELMVYNRTLSADQIYAIYRNQSNTLVGAEQKEADNWSLCATPINGTDSGTRVCSGGLQVVANTTFRTGMGSITSVVPQGEKPFVIRSSTLVRNLNANYLGGADSNALRKRTCVPMYNFTSTTSTTYTQVYKCTNCSGWIITIGCGQITGGAIATANLTIDGRSVWFNNYGYTENAYSNTGFIVEERFNNNLTMMVRSATSGNNVGGHISGCIEVG